MKFNSLDTNLNNWSFSTTDLIQIDEIRPNPIDSRYPAFIFKGGYIKTITRIPWIDFYNLTLTEKDTVIFHWWRFLAQLKCPTQIFIRSKKIDTEKYLKEAIKQIEDSPYIHEEIKREMIRGLPMTLEYIKEDSQSTPYVKEYYLVTSCTPRFFWSRVEEDPVNEDDTKDYSTGKYQKMDDIQFRTFADNFTRYYQDIVPDLISICGIDEVDRNIVPLSREQDIIWLLAEINNDIPMKAIQRLEEL